MPVILPGRPVFGVNKRQQKSIRVKVITKYCFNDHSLLCRRIRQYQNPAVINPKMSICTVHSRLLLPELLLRFSTILYFYKKKTTRSTELGDILKIRSEKLTQKRLSCHKKNTTLFSEIPWTSPGRSSINCQKHELKYKTEKYKTGRYITG